MRLAVPDTCVRTVARRALVAHNRVNAVSAGDSVLNELPKRATLYVFDVRPQGYVSKITCRWGVNKNPSSESDTGFWARVASLIYESRGCCQWRVGRRACCA